MAAPSAAVDRALDRSRWRACCFLVALNVVFPLWLFLAGLPQPWDAFYGEESPINWFSSVQLAVLCVLGILVAWITRLGIVAGTERTTRSWPWLLVGVGFGFLCLDEYFMIHEGVRELVLIPRGVLTNISWLHSGDVVLIGYAAAGAVLALALYADLKRYRAALILFVVALVTIGVVATQDSLNLKVFKIEAVRRAQIILEETFEVWAQALFGCSLLLVFFAKLRAFLHGREGR